MLEEGGPVSAFTDALQRRDLARIAQLLGPEVTLSVPPLRLTRAGSSDVLAGIRILLDGFGELRYEIRSRYLAPGTVTDEAVVVGRQTGWFLDAAPSDQTSSVAARMIIHHDNATITSITVWPDLTALRQALSDTRVIDLTRVGQAEGMVAALRATMPPSPVKVIRGTSHESPANGLPILLGLPDPEAETPEATTLDRIPFREVPKPPIPRSVRRRRAFIAGSIMLTASIVITVWVIRGALRSSTSPLGSASTGSASSGSLSSGSLSSGSLSSGSLSSGSLNSGSLSSGSLSSGSRNPWSQSAGDRSADGQTPEPTPTLRIVGNQVIVPADLLFDTDKATLTPPARTLLAGVINQARQEHRSGLVTVNGYTDDRGSPAYNLALSKRRAQAVAAALQAGFKGTRIRFVSHGYGMSDPIRKNTTPDGRQHNRRVTVRFQALTAPTPRTTG